MSFWDELKELLYKPVKQDSRNLEKLGQAWNIPWLENEANRNVDNPGRAVGKAAASAATWWLGHYGGDYGLGSAAGSAASGAAGVGAQAAVNAAVEAGKITAAEGARIIAEQAAMEAAKQGATQAATGGIKEGLLGGWNSLKDGIGSMGDSAQGLLYRAVPGAGKEQTSMLAQQTGDFGAYGLGKTMEAASTAQGLSPLQQFAGQYGGKALGLLGGAGGNMADAKKAEMMKMGMGLLEPQQPQQPMPQPMPRQQAPQEPLPLPYTNSLQGPPPGMSMQEWEKLKRMKMMGRM
jgi:hypothetical protein